ncbi:MAG TPA: response regulator, partial [Nannocystaceae bacterium]|nr:response regulator [Nannocystaceae bacterium]
LESTMTMGVHSSDGDAPQQPPAQLVVLVGPDAGRRYPVAEELLIGRDAEVGLAVHDDGVSRRHSRILRSEAGDFTIEDLGSRNGTYLNGKRITASPLRPGDKIAIGTGTILLFTRHDRYEEQVLQAQKLHLLGQLAGGIAHDFNNLIVTVLGNVTYLKDNPPTGTELSDCLDEIETAARRAAELTSQLMSFSRPHRRSRETVDVGKLIHEVVGLLRRTVPRSLEIITDVGGDLTVAGDTSQLLQVLMNGCINAKQAMPHGGVLRVEARPVRPTAANKSSFVRIVVEDSGLGMDEAILGRVFQPFFTTKPKGEGTGLGLATAYRIVRDHGGDITMTSELGVGSRLVITLPAAEVEDTVPVSVEHDTQSKLEGRVLVVDDEPLVRSTARRMLERFGLRVSLAVDGVDALAVHARESERFDVAIVDLDMPNLDGEQTIVQLRARDPHLPVIIASGHADSERTRRLMARGRISLLPKPFDAAGLWRHVSAVLQGANHP